MTMAFAIYGASGHGKVIFDILRDLEEEVCCVIDDRPDGRSLFGIPAIDFDTFCDRYADFSEKPKIVVAIGANIHREIICKKVWDMGYETPTVVAKSAVVSGSVNIEKGCVIMPLAVVNADTRILKGAIINSGSVIENDCIIGEFVHIDSKATLCGSIYVGNFTHIGANSVVVPNVNIGAHVTVGAGSVVVNNILGGKKVAGNPAKKESLALGLKEQK